jgi:hypothetical protein
VATQVHLNRLHQLLVMGQPTCSKALWLVVVKVDQVLLLHHKSSKVSLVCLAICKRKVRRASLSHLAHRTILSRIMVNLKRRLSMVRMTLTVKADKMY